MNGALPFTMRVGQVSCGLIIVHQQYSVECSAFLTAWNPYSHSVDNSINMKKQLALTKELTQRNLQFIDGVGQHPNNDWLGEESCLILGLTLEASKTLGARLEQSGIVWSGINAIPQLILLR